MPIPTIEVHMLNPFGLKKKTGHSQLPYGTHLPQK